MGGSRQIVTFAFCGGIPGASRPRSASEGSVGRGRAADAPRAVRAAGGARRMAGGGQSEAAAALRVRYGVAE